MQKLWRIYTEDKNRSEIVTLATLAFPGATIIPTIGVWNGQQENSLIVEVIGVEEENVREFAECVRERNGQESVYVVGADVEAFQIVEEKVAS